jgi:hypothetical protein
MQRGFAFLLPLSKTLQFQPKTGGADFLMSAPAMAARGVSGHLLYRVEHKAGLRK